MRTRIELRTTLAAGGLALLSGCPAVAYPGHGHPKPGDHVHIPPGHLPPPGACRIWFPDRPPGQQPPPGPCHVLRRHVP